MSAYNNGIEPAHLMATQKPPSPALFDFEILNAPSSSDVSLCFGSIGLSDNPLDWDLTPQTQSSGQGLPFDSIVNSGPRTTTLPPTVTNFAFDREISPGQRSDGRRSDKAQAYGPNKNPRPHYAVEKRYRSELNVKYAALARRLSSDATQGICQSEISNWTAGIDAPSSTSRRKDSLGARQSKTATLSTALDAIRILERCCSREAKKVEDLKRGIDEIKNRGKRLLDAHSPESAPTAKT